MRRYLLYYVDARSLAYVLEKKALRDVRSGAAVLDKMVLEPDFTVRHILRSEERAFYAQEEPGCDT